MELTSNAVMGLDVGSKAVGVAISDPLGFTAQGVEIIKIDEEAEEFGFDRLRQSSLKNIR